MARDLRASEIRKRGGNRIMTSITGYRRPYFETQPAYLYPGYRSTVKRSPSRPLVLLPHTLTEVTGPVFGYDDVKSTDSDLTRQHEAEPIGERIVVSGRDRKSTRLNSSHVEISYAVFCLKKKKP